MTLTHPALARPIALAALCLLGASPFASFDPPGRPADPRVDFVRTPMLFTVNEGQLDEDIDFSARGRAYSALLSGGEARLRLNREGEAAEIRLKPLGMRPPGDPVPLDLHPSKTHIYAGADPANWHEDLDNYQRVEYRGVYDGVDLAYYGNQQTLEYDFIVAPGADPNQIRLGLEGIDDIEIGDDGSMLLSAGEGRLRFEKPYVYQEIGGERRQVDGEYLLAGVGEFGFSLGEYDPELPLVIDPMLTFAIYVGSSISDDATAIAIDASLGAYVAGRLADGSLEAASVTKFNAAGVQQYQTLVRSSAGGETAGDLFVDSNESAVICGITENNDLPSPGGPTVDPLSGGVEVFVTRLLPTGNLAFSTYVGGVGNEGNAGRCAVAGSMLGNTYVVSDTGNIGGLGVTHGSFSGGVDVFVAELNGLGAINFLTLLGGPGDDLAIGVGFDDVDGLIYVAGQTNMSFPNVGIGSDPYTAGQDGFLASITQSTVVAEYVTFIGGTGDEFVIDMDSIGFNIAFYTATNSTGLSNNGSAATGALVAVYEISGLPGFVFGGELAAGYTRVGRGVGLDFSGNVLITGNSSNDVFLARLNNALDEVDFITFGGPNTDFGNAVAFDGGSAQVVGSAQAAFPTTGGPAFGGATDGFYSKVLLNLDPDDLIVVGLDHISRVDPTTGFATKLIRGDSFADLVSVAVDSNRNIVAAQNQPFAGIHDIFVFDPDTGIPTPLHSFNSSNFTAIGPIAIEENGDILVGLTNLAGAPELHRFDISTMTAARVDTVLLPGQAIGGIAIERGGATAIISIVGAGVQQLRRINLSTGTHTQLGASPGIFNDLRGVTLEPDGTILVADFVADQLLSVDPATGAQSVRSTGPMGGGSHPFEELEAIVIEKDGAAVVVHDPGEDDSDLYRIPAGSSTATRFSPPDIVTFLLGLDDLRWVDSVPCTPAITGVAPSPLPLNPVANVNATLTLSECGIYSSKVSFNGIDLDPNVTVVGATQIDVVIPMAQLTSSGMFPFVVDNPAPNNETSAPFMVMVGGTPPTLTMIAPTFTDTISPPPQLTLTGTDFTPTATVQFNGSNLATVFFDSATQLRADLTASEVATAGMFGVTVTTAGGPTAAQTFTVNNPPAMITSTDPTSVTVGAPATLIRFLGNNIEPGAVVEFDGVDQTTNFINSTEVQATIAMGDLATARIVPVNIRNAAPGGGKGADINFTVGNPVPVLTSLSQTTATINDAGFNLVVTGINFVNGATVQIDGVDFAGGTTFNNSTQLTAAVQAADLDLGGTKRIRVMNPGPLGGFSGTLDFVITTPFADGDVLVSEFNTELSHFDVGTGTQSSLLLSNDDGTRFPVGPLDFQADGEVVFADEEQTFTLTITDPSTSLATRESYRLENVSQTGLDIVGLSLAFGDAGAGRNFDCATDFTQTNNMGAMIVPTLVTPDMDCSGGATDTLVAFTFTDFEPSDVFNWTADIDPDSAPDDWRQVLFPDAVLTVDFSDGSQYRVILNPPAPLGATSFLFDDGIPSLYRYNPSTGDATLLTRFNQVDWLSATAVKVAQSGDIYTALISNSDGEPQIVVYDPVLDTQTQLTAATGLVGDQFEDIALERDNNLLVTVHDANQIRRINATTGAQTIISNGLTSIGGFGVVSGPRGITIGADGRIYFASEDDGSLHRIDEGAATIEEINGGFFGPRDVGFDALGNLYVVDRGATLSDGTLQRLAAPAFAAHTVISAADLAEVDSLAPVPCVPTLTSINPTNVTVGTATTLTVMGSCITNRSSVAVDGTTFIVPTNPSATMAMAVLPASVTNTVGTYNIDIRTPTPHDGISGSMTFTVDPPPNPTPDFTTMSVLMATVGDPDLAVTVTGANFVPGMTMNFGALVLPTTFINATTANVTIPSAAFAADATVSVTIENPPPGGGVSSASMNFDINNPVPTLTSISPNLSAINGAAFTMTLMGANFITGDSTADFQGTGLVTTFVSSTELQATVPMALLNTVGVFNVTVITAGTGGGMSAPQPFSVTLAFAPDDLVTTNLNGLHHVDIPGGTFTFLSDFGETEQGVDFEPGGTVFYVSQNAGLTMGTLNRFNFADSTTAMLNTFATPGGAMTASVATERAGTLLIARSGGGIDTIERYNPASNTFSAAVAGALVGTPSGLVVDRNDDFYYSSSATNQIVRVEAGTMAQTVVTTGGNLAAVMGLDILPNGDIVAVSNNNAMIVSVDPTTGTQTVISAGGLLTNPVDVDILSDGDLVVSDSPDGDIVRIDAVTAVQSEFLAGANPSVPFLAVAQCTPQITSVTGVPLLASAGAQVITVNGSCLDSTSATSFGGTNGSVITTTVIDATQLQANIPGALTMNTGNFDVEVTNSLPEPRTSNAVSVAVNNPVPTVLSLDITSAIVGSPGFTLTVMGTGFTPTTQVTFAGVGLTTTFVNNTTVTAAVTPTELAAAGMFGVGATNVAPGGGMSGVINFTVNNPVPAITSLVPATLLVGGPATTVRVNGMNFVPGAVVNIDGVPAATTFINAGALDVVVPATTLIAAGTPMFTVFNPAPGGGLSAPVALSVENPVPGITSLSDPIVTVGDPAFTLTVMGVNLLPGTQVLFDGVPRPTTFVNATTVTVMVTAADLSAVRTIAVSLRNPAPGGGDSPTLPLTVGDPVPVLTSVTPAMACLDDGALVITATGVNFNADSQIMLGALALTTTLVDAMTLTATIPATSFALAAGAATTVTVTNTATGSVSAALPFAINPPLLTPANGLAPTTVLAGATPTPITLTGTCLPAGGTITRDGAAQPTTFAAGALTATITPGPPGMSQIAALGPSGATSDARTLYSLGLTSIAPTSVNAGSTNRTLTVNGGGFVNGSTIRVGGAALITTFVGPTTLSATLPANLIATSGDRAITVRNPDGVTSAALTLSVEPRPRITALRPASTLAGRPLDLTLGIFGQNFLGSLDVLFGEDILTPFSSSERDATVNIPAALLADVGFTQVSVQLGSGSRSDPVNFETLGPVITSAEVSRPVFSAGPPAPQQLVGFLTVNGMNFAPDAADVSVTVNGNPAAVSSASSTQILGSVPLADATPGALVVVTNFDAVPSSPIAVEVETVSLSGIAPGAATVGAPGVPTVITGQGFQPGSTVDFGGTIIVPTSIDPTTITFTIPQSLLAAPGVVAVAVITSGGDRSGELAFIVNQPLTLNGAGPPPAMTGEPYSAPLGGDGGTGDFTYLAPSGLPPGLELDPNTGVLSGTPEEPGEFTIDVVVSDQGGVFAAQRYILQIEGGLIVPGRLSFELGSQTQFDEQILALGADGDLQLEFSVESGSDFLSIEPGDESGTVTPGVFESVLVRAARGNRDPGVYNGLLRVRQTGVVLSASQQIAGAGQTVAVAMTVNPSDPVLRPTQTGLTFIGALDGPPPGAQSFGIANPGSELLNWEIEINTQGTGNWLSVDPLIGSTDPDLAVPVVTVAVDPSEVALPDGLDPLALYAQLTLRSAEATNSPERMTVVFDLAGADGAAAPTVDPQGLVFKINQQGEFADREVIVSNSSSAAVDFTVALGDGAPGVFLVDVNAGSVGGAADPQATIPVRVNVDGLAPGTYASTLDFAFTDATGPLSPKQVSLLLIVPEEAAALVLAKQQGACQPGDLELAFQAPGEGNPIKFGFPAAIRLEVSDNCGQPMTDGSVSVAFSNGDPQLFLNDLRSGTWEATWQQQNPLAQGVTMTAFASRRYSETVLAEGTAEVTVDLQDNPAAPPVILALTNSAGFRESSITPGMLMSIFGTDLGFAAEAATSLPLPEVLGGTSIQMGDRFGAMIFGSTNQANVQAPFESTPSTLGPVTIFRSDLAISNRVDTEIERAEPAVFVDGNSLLAIVTNPSFQLVTPQRRVKAGDVLIAFMSGLGPVDPAVGTGVASPVPPAVVSNVRMLIDGQEVQPLFTGLTPGFVGLYQLNFIVPEGLAAEGPPHLLVIVEVGGEPSPEFRLPFER